MDLDEIKRGLRAEIMNRENETYSTFRCNVRQMCKDVLAKLEEQESEIAELEERIADGDKDFEMVNNQNERLLKFVRHHKHKRCLAMSKLCRSEWAAAIFIPEKCMGEKHAERYMRWEKRWLKLAEKFKEAK